MEHLEGDDPRASTEARCCWPLGRCCCCSPGCWFDRGDSLVGVVPVACVAAPLAAQQRWLDATSDHAEGLLTPANSLHPVSTGDRIAVLDALRGVALVGILVANLLVFAGVVFLDDNARAAQPWPKVDAGVRWLQVIFVEGKFYGLFSLLFGMGAAMQLDSGHDPARNARFRRRMLVLGVIGLVHSMIWTGDILLFYAVLGLLLPRAARLEPRVMVRLGLGMFAAAAAWQYLVFGGTTMLGLPSGWPFILAWDYLEPHYVAMDAAQARGDVLLMIRYNLTAIWADRWPGLLSSGRPFKVFGFFLIGMWAVRAGIPAALRQHRPLLVRVAWWGVCCGVPSAALFAAGRFLDRDGPVGAIMPMAESGGILALTLGYAACVALVWDRSRPTVLRMFEPLGRMALSIYLTQTLICLYGLSGLGVGWFMQIGAAAATAIAFPVIAVQLLFAHWWLSRYRFGPAEWLWRSLTYGVRQPMRRR